MSLRLYMDVHVPATVTRGLRDRGVDVVTSQEDLTDDWDDSTLVDRATELGRVLFSLDADMRREAAVRQKSGRPFSGIVVAEQLGITIGQCVEQLELIAAIYEPSDIANQIEYLPIR